eukprot:CAMPEP_0117512702 /NCGR_PEP_ID=MMETSP0784-20121206/29171_1 /TAXON_ID=39447 /ORGANISM="" /LENGTH=385 /DNA_ID=CAMNT_0005308437 /DNA_START=75 /DNA_END=1229 /DNA_ORIENTATION=+
MSRLLGGLASTIALTTPPPRRPYQCIRRFATGLRVCAMHTVSVTEERLREFLASEITFFAGQEATPISLQQVLDAATPRRAAELSFKELPIRFAKRITQIEELPGWERSPELASLRSLYFQTFRELRLLDSRSSDLADFTEVVVRIKQRMQRAVPLLMEAVHGFQERGGGLDGIAMEHWLDRFLLARIGTEMLTSQFMACSNNEGSIVHPRCDPVLICARAAEKARWLCMQHQRRAGQTVHIDVETIAGASGSATRLCFPYVPKYLFYMVLELLKNSARATVETASSQAEIQARPIVVTVSANARTVAIRVQDRAGGVPLEVADRVWAYTYSTASKGSPLAGYGVGLPLSRLYARYLGGSLHLMSMPGEGTAAYLYLKRLGEESR